MQGPITDDDDEQLKYDEDLNHEVMMDHRDELDRAEQEEEDDGHGWPVR